MKRLRSLVQHLGFFIFMYGGRFGIHLGSAVPCFACPFVPGCGGYCYLMGLQGYVGFGMSAGAALGAGLLSALSWLALFILLVGLFGKLWCGWLCPLGLVQDWASSLRRRLSVRERQFSVRTKKRIFPVKYVFLAGIAVLPPLITLGVLHEDFYLPFCSICPGKSLLPLFAAETRYLALNFDNVVSLGLSAALLAVTGVTLVGMFFRDRFFCAFCPLLALIHLLKPFTALRLIKDPQACTGCGNCRRVCPMGIEEVYRQRTSADVQTAECLDCAQCVGACPSNGALGIEFLTFNLFSSSQNYVAGVRKK